MLLHLCVLLRQPQISSVYYGWGFLILCGGGSYYFAKKSVTKDRYERKAMENDRRYRQSQILDATQQSSVTLPNATGREGGT
jgi:hypothetical protein